MFNALASLLKGSEQATMHEADSKENVCDEIPDAEILDKTTTLLADALDSQVESCGDDDEWVLVDIKEHATSARKSVSGLDGVLSELELRSVPSSTDASMPATPNSACWQVTPPPCFTDSGAFVHAGVLEVSNFENLLIEHPSRSVYRRDSGQSNASSLPPPQSATDGLLVGRRPLTLADFMPAASLLDSGARLADLKLQQARACRELGKQAVPTNQRLDRANAVRNVEPAGSSGAARKKRACKSFSGRNNDRKCQ